ncbi:MAG: anhydro-N-acetylmuramic acid kinase, partial [Gammaproteobacteria bacterium]
SMDGVDAALARFGAGGAVETLACDTLPYPPTLRARLLAVITPGATLSLHEFGTLDVDVGRHFAAAARAVLDRARVSPGAVAALGSHGQTLRHHPLPPTPYTLQIGCGATIAALTGLTTVADFRRIDVACGGQGAPLVPPFHAASLGSAVEDRIILNIGGIANLSHLAAGADSAVLGYDSGPGNCLMDEWNARHRGTAFDRDGAWAATGEVCPALLEAFLADDYFQAPAPKSTGRELFNLALVDAHLSRLRSTLAAADVQSTLCQLTVESIARAVESSASRGAANVYVCGGGARNRELMARLANRLAPRRVAPTDELGIDASFVEALAFAWYAKRRLEQQPTILTTGGPLRAMLLGVVHEPCS